MFCVFLLLSVLVVGVRCRTCDCAQYTPARAEDLPEGESVTWINEAIRAFYYMNSESLFQMLSGIIDTEVNPKLPDPVKSLDLLHFSLTETPKIDLVSHHVTTVTCDDATFKRYTLDFDVSFHNPGKLAKVRAVLALGISATVSLEDVRFNTVLRAEVLLSSEVALPSIQNVRVMFMEQPKLDFDLELNDMIGLDTFGIEKWIRGQIDKVLQEKLVYPGMLYVDMTSNKPQTSMINNDPRLHPAVLSTKITVVPVKTTRLTNDLEVWLEYGDDDVSKVKFPASTEVLSYQFDVYVDDFKHTDARVIVKEIGTFTDDVWVDLSVNLARDIRSGSTRRAHVFQHDDSGSIWNVTVDVNTFLLPSIQINPDTATLFPSLFSQTNSTSCGDYGVLYIALHGGYNLVANDGGKDPYVKILLDGKEIGRTATAASENPTYNFVYETLIRAKGGILSDHVIEFKAYDWDRWSSDDFIGSARVGARADKRVAERVPISANNVETGALSVTVLFIPVPFF